MTSRVVIRLCLGLFGVATLASAAVAQPPLIAELNCGVSHSFTGFGLNVWPLPGRERPLMALLKEMRVNFVRWKLLPDLERANIQDALSFSATVRWVEDFALTQDDVAGQGGFTFFNRLNSLGINQLAASWAVPTKWRIAHPTSEQRNPSPIDDLRIDDYGRLLAAEIAVLERRSIRPYAIELLNEPITKISPDQYTRLLNSFRKWRIQSNLPAIHVAGPGAVHTWDNVNFLRALAQAGSRLDIVSTHTWDSNETRRLASLAPLTRNIPAGWSAPLFVTEYGFDEDRWYRSPYTGGPRTAGGGRNAVDDVPFGVATAAQTLALLGSGANAVFYWEAQDPPWSDKNWGLLSKEDRPRPAVDALRTIVRPLEVGDRIASAGRRDEALPIAVIARPSQLLVEVANPEPAARAYDISLHNCTMAPLAVAHSEVWPADRQIEARPGPGGVLHVSLPGDTVASIVTNR